MGTDINFIKHLGHSGGGASIQLPSDSFEGFIMELNVTGASTFQLRGRNVGTYNAQVDWGDGTVETVTAYNGGTHAYASTGTYQIKISGDFPGFEYGNTTGTYKDYITKIVQWGNIEWKSFYRAFASLSYLTSLPTDYPDITGLIDKRPYQMFFNNIRLVACDLSNWQNTGNFVGSAFQTFYGLNSCTNINLTGWDTSGFTGVQDFMANCGRGAGGCTVTAPNLDWSGTNTLYRMFYRSCLKADTDISNWTLRAAGVNLNRFFYESGGFSTPTFSSVSEVDMSTWNNTSGITSMQYFMFNANAIKNINVTNWDTSNVTNTFRAFYGCVQLEEIIGLSTIDISSVSSGDLMFYNTRKLKFNNHNFGTSWNNWAAATFNFSQFFYRNGYSLSDANAGPTPTVANWSMPNATGNIYNLFREAKYTAGSTITLNWNYPNCTTLQQSFYILKGVSTLNINMTTTNVLVNFLNCARGAASMSSITFGSNMDFSGVTNFQTAFYSMAGTCDLVFDSAVDFSSVTNLVSIVGGGSRKMTTSSYDAFLVRLEATNSNTVGLSAGQSNYTGSGAGGTARAALIADHGWTITDGGPV